MRILICGDRNWNDLQKVYDTLKEYPNVEYVIEGEARGADTCGKIAAEMLDIPVLKFPADWTKYGKSAGPIRNHQMLIEGKPDLILAFHDDILNSKGTKNMVTQALKSLITARIIKHD
jgi:hypothetical protein